MNILLKVIIINLSFLENERYQKLCEENWKNDEEGNVNLI